MAKQTQDSSQWHRVAAKHMLEMRGWSTTIKAPREVVDDVFAAMVRQRSEAFYSAGVDPIQAAINMQHDEWNS